jgi:hypothetical protein
VAQSLQSIGATDTRRSIEQGDSRLKCLFFQCLPCEAFLWDFCGGAVNAEPRQNLLPNVA